MDFKTTIMEALASGKITEQDIERVAGVEIDEDGVEYLIDILDPQTESARRKTLEDLGLADQEPVGTAYEMIRAAERARAGNVSSLRFKA